MTDRIDPRRSVIDRRLSGVKRVIAVTGGKGGIGKSVVSSVLALVAARSGRKVGLLDADLTSPTDHVILGRTDEFPTEEFGIEPPFVAGVRFMSLQYFLRDGAAPLRGQDVTDALVEILAVTHWGDLDLLVVDMPPGLGDATLDAVQVVPRAECLVVANGSAVVLETVRRMLRLLVELRSPILGIVENMERGAPEAVEALASAWGVPFLGRIPTDASLERAFGNPGDLTASAVGRAIEGIFSRD